MSVEGATVNRLRLERVRGSCNERLKFHITWA